MLPGVTGHLVAAKLLETLEFPPQRQPTIEHTRRRLSAWRRAQTPLGPASTTRTLFETAAAPLAALLGYEVREPMDAPSGTIAAALVADRRVATLLATPWREPLSGLWRTAVAEAARRSTRWCLVCNGTNLSIVDARRLYARRFLDFDLGVVIEDDRSLTALWRTSSPVALAADDSAESLSALIVASDHHAAAVCRSLRNGVLEASADVVGALMAGRRFLSGTQLTSQLSETFEQALTIVYRILFLLFAEARLLVPLWHAVYRESYSIDSLRQAAEQSPRPAGLWDALRAIARLAHRGCRAGDLHVAPFNGRLFAPSRTPLAERRDLDDAAARRAILALSTRPAADRSGREVIAYRDLGVEQLGAVYETLLDYQPRLTPGRHGTVVLQAGSGIRKSTGTFYTPQPIAEYLVRRTLGPLVRQLSPEGILRLRIVDPAMGSGAFLVAACRYLAAAYERAIVTTGACHAAEITEHDRIRFRRTVAERCLYGVDVNPMAVQLARLSLWLTTLASDRPLTFLDHRLMIGDSLLGAWLTNLRRPPSRPARHVETLPLFSDEIAAGALRGALPVRFSLESPANTLEDVRVKERALASLALPDGELSKWKRVADAWCATWFGRASDPVPAAAFGSLRDGLIGGRGELPDRTTATYLGAAEAIARTRRFFHWELEFPEVFFDRAGAPLAQPGFDAVLGNPPWDMIRAHGGQADSTARPRREDTAAFLRFTRDSGVYRSQSKGHANSYQLFVERAVALTAVSGRIGLVLPAGLATDCGSAPLRRLLLEGCDVDAIVGIDNRRGVFPIHRSVRFLLITASRGAPTRSIACRLDIDDPAALEQIDDDPRDRAATWPVHLSPAILERLSGPDLAIPNIRTAMDLAICEKASALFATLGSDAGWSAAFSRELNASDDRAAFGPAGRGLPIVDGKHLNPFRVSLGSSSRSISARDARRLLGGDRFDRSRLAYRDVASATNRMTLIAAILPSGCVSTHTVFCLRTPLCSRVQHFLCGLFNSFVVNYLARIRVTTHVTSSVLEHLPVPTAQAAPAALREISAIARLLSRRSNDEALATLNARVAALYRLTRAEFEHVLSTFPLVPIEHRRAALRSFASDPAIQQ